MKTAMKPSTARLLSMLPRTLIMRIDVVKGAPAGIDLLDGQGKPTGLDADYPGFAECLGRLVSAGRVIHAADIRTGTPDKGRIERVFMRLDPTELPS